MNWLGTQNPDLLAALATQAHKLWHASNVFYTEPPLRLAEELVEASGFAERVFLCNSGAEANEAAIKLVRRWAAAQGRAPEQRTIITFKGSFHGRTLATVTATAQPKYQAGYEPLPAGFRYLKYNDVPALELAFAAGDIAAVMLEPIQGEGGVVPAAPGFLERVRELCDSHDALLVLDEIQCGMGRTGALFAHGQITPDIVTLAKALGGGFPIGAMLARAEGGRHDSNTARTAPPSAATRWRRRWRAWRWPSWLRRRSSPTWSVRPTTCAPVWPGSINSWNCSRKCAGAA
ncbi:Acetylornithine/succinyldiaminopimelate aminotransferase [Rhodanobacter lindaniclasticus]